MFPQRAQVADEQLRVARNLFTEDHCTFEGEHYSYEDIAFYPKAHESRSRSGAAARAAARSGAPAPTATPGFRTSRG